jgi:DNA-binding Lrp family transcriptional regulator
MTLDRIDRALLILLQEDATRTAPVLGARLGLSASQAARRRQRLEREGFVTGTHAHVAPDRVGLGVQAFVSVEMAVHAPDAAKALSRKLEANPEIVSAWTLTGDADYLLRVFCADLAALNRLIHEDLLPHPAVARVRSQIVMDQFKADAPLPV